MSEKQDEPAHTRDLQLGSRARLRAFVLLALTVAGIYVCYLLLLPFLPGLVWALALAIIFMPVHRWVEAKLINGDIAAAISVLLLGLIVVIPIVVVSSWILESAAEGAAAAHDMITSGRWRRSLETNEVLAPLNRWIGHVNLQGIVENLTTWADRNECVLGWRIDFGREYPPAHFLSLVLFFARPRGRIDLASQDITALQVGNGPTI